MNIVYVANEKYVEYLCISLISLLENNKGDLNIYIISIGITDKSKNILKDSAKIYSKSLEIIEFYDIQDKFDYKPDVSRFDISALGRLFLSDLLPKSVEKIIYLDCDTIILKNIEGLYNIDLKDKLLGAVIEPTIYPELKIDIGIYEDVNYYNSGVLLIDLKKYRDTDAKKIVLTYLESINDYCLFTDQDAINGAFLHRIKVISPKYNFITNYRYWKYKDLVSLSKGYKIIPKKVFEAAKRNPYILHFAGDERPWNRWNLNYYRKYYFKYKRKSYFAMKKQKPANIFYMFAYHMMNIMTLFLPNVRLYISKYFYYKLKKEKFIKNKYGK